MGTRKRFLADTHLDFVNKGAVNDFLFNKMVLFVSFLWFLTTTLLVSLFTFIATYLFRFHIHDNSQKGDSNSPPLLPQGDSSIAWNSFEQKPEPEKADSNILRRLPHDDNSIVSNSLEQKLEPQVIEFEDSEYDGFGDKETPKFSFKFQFQTSDFTSSSYGESSRIVSPDEASAASTSKYQFLPSKDFRGFMEEPQVVSFTVKELYMNSNEDLLNNEKIVDNGFLSEKDFVQNNSEKEVVHEDIINDSCISDDSVVLDEFLHYDEDQSVHFDMNSPHKEDFSSEIQLLSEKEFLGFDSDLESENFGDRYTVMNNIMDSGSDAFSSDEDFDGEVEHDNILKVDEENIVSSERFQNSDEIHLEKSWTPGQGEVDICDPLEKIESVKGFQYSEEIQLEKSTLDKEDVGISDQIEETELLKGFQNSEQFHLESAIDQVEVGLGDRTSPVENLLARFEAEIDVMNDSENSDDFHFQKLSDLETDAQLEREYCEIKAECDGEDFGGRNAELKHGSEKPEESNSQDSSYMDSEDSNDLEILWEHQHLIEQLKMELKKVRATGLPTILEESESPRMSEDLKPWKIDEKFLHEDRMDELQKFYKTYRERMRKFDILNYQKMYAIGFLQLKDPLQSISIRKSSTPTLTSVLSQSFRLPKRQKPEEDSTVKFVRELQSDLEMVYVGQLCLSWEILHWQYGKTRELLDSDPYESRQYNEVAGEFQQFQVLMQRFMENEPFQGPRVHNYIKNRCILRNLLQVPVVKEDSKDKEGRRRRKDAITCSMLFQIIEESIMIFWDFVRADKDEGNVILKGLLRPQVELQDPADSELLVDVKTNLQKKEKKLKDNLRSGNCIVRKFQKHHEEERPDQLLFFSQIDLKLVSRVLKMSRITSEQLLWCQKKLNKINFVHRKLHVESSFLLFPC